MNGPPEFFIKATAALIVAGGMIWLARHVRRPGAALVAGLLAVLGIAVYVNGLAGHGRGRFVHPWEQFHYWLGSRYFDELGYDGLYAASITAFVETRPDRPPPSKVRDLRDNRTVALAEIADHARDVRARFTDERWAAFKADHRMFERRMPDFALRWMWQDYGHNATPTWSAVGRAVTSLLPREPHALAVAGWLDVVLLAAAVLVVARVYGPVYAAAVVATFGVGHLWRFWWIGGAFLRLDWLCALISTMACLRRRAWRGAGALLALATVLRVFPGIFLLPLAAAAVGQWRRGRPTLWFRRLTVAFAVTLATGLLVGASTAHGWSAWGMFVKRITQHERGWTTNDVGLKVAVASIPTAYQGLGPDRTSVDPWAPWSDAMDRAAEKRRWLFLPLALAITLVALMRGFDSEPELAMAFGVALVYAWSNPSSYYGALLLLLVLAGGPGWAAAIAGLSAVLHAINGFVSVYPPVYSVASWLVVLATVAFLRPDRLLPGRRTGAAT